MAFGLINHRAFLKTSLAVLVGLMVGCAADDDQSATGPATSSGVPSVETQSAMLSDGSPAPGQVPECQSASSDADADGWGWENQRTCFVDTQNRVSGDTSSELPVGIVYYLWHCATKVGGTDQLYREFGLNNGEEFNITHVLNGEQATWGRTGNFHWWDEPDEGYYCLGDEPGVVASHLNMLRDAGVDFLVLDITNHPNTESLNASDLILSSLHTLLDVASEISDSPRIVPWVPLAADSESTVSQRNAVCASGDSEACADMHAAQPMYKYVTDLLQNKYSDLAFEYEGKPLIIEAANERKYASSETDIVRTQLENAWTVRPMWGLGSNEDHWQFLTTCDNPVDFYESHGWTDAGCNQSVNAGEQISVTAAYQYTYISEPFSVAPGSYSGFTGGMPKFQGRTMAQQFRVAFEQRDSQPMVILTGWNEWIAQRFDLDGRTAFVDVYDHNLNRDIEPGGISGDLYYYLMKDLITQYRGQQPFVFEDYFLTEKSIFDAEFYWNTYPDLQQVFDVTDEAGLLNHWLTVGIVEGRRPGLVFNATYYRDLYPQLADAGITTLEALARHFINYGFQEGRRGSAEFHAPSYLNRYPGVAAIFGNNGHYKAYRYYLDVGQFAPHNQNAQP